MTRRALVLGCGGTIGGAWTIAALHAYAAATAWDPRNAAVLQGTSAGAEIITLLAGGYGTAELVAMQSGATDDPLLRRHRADTPPGVPPMPGLRPMRPSALWTRHGGHTRLAGIAPRGRGDAAWLQRLADAVSGPEGRLPHRSARMVAYAPDTGERVAFGATDAPPASAGEALRASWAIPGWMPPVSIGGRDYLDGGTASTASVDLISSDDADEVVVIASMASERGTRGPGATGVAEHLLLRRPMSETLRREVAQIRAQGIRVTVITPGAEDLRALGANFMSRRGRDAAFRASQRTAPAAVQRALSKGDR